MKRLYALLHVRPGPRAQAVLFDDAPPEGSKLAGVKAAAETPEQAARLIAAHDVPFRVAVHQIVGWKVKEYFRDQPDAVPLPETWEVAGDDDPEREVVGRQWVAEAIARLDGRERQVLELRYWYGMEHDQIALELQITRNNVDQILWRGHKTIREALGV